MNAVTIYAICERGTPRYVGQTIHPKRRFKRHASNAVRGDMEPLYQWWRSQAEPPTFEVLDVSSDLDAETFWIAYLRFLGCDLLNCHLGRDTAMAVDMREKIVAAVHRPEVRARILASPRFTGGRHSQETKDRIAAAHRGMKRPRESVMRGAAKRKGRHHTDAAKEKLRAAHLGMRASAETIEKARLRMTGKKLPQEWCDNIRKGLNNPEVRERMRARRIGRKHSPESIKRMSEAQRRMNARLRSLNQMLLWELR